ncbi:MAG: Rieske (2Fe-2S) protein [Acidimicrobiia bacterium]|nr:Rieske (2Fe-2S) protein [Acidimicrobiia bacterium]
MTHVQDRPTTAAPRATGGLGDPLELAARNRPRQRFPFSDKMPLGWYQVAYSDELLPGDVVPLAYWKRDLVLWREADGGDAHLMDAFCAHLGAHLGYGGVVEGDAIRCPFHHWCFDGGGSCVDIPYSDKVNRKAHVGTYPVQEKAGIVWAWFHPNGDEPAWDIPDVPEYADEDYTDYHRFEWTLRSSPQELGENQVDIAHFKYIHGTVVVPELLETHIDGPHSHVRTEHKFDTPIGPQPGHIQSDSYGFGYAVVRFSGIVDTCLVTSCIPIDEEFVHLRFSFMHKKLGDAKADSTVADHLIADIRRQIEEDTPIWEHKAYVDKPALADGDGPFTAYRKYVRQFYAD